MFAIQVSSLPAGAARAQQMFRVASGAGARFTILEQSASIAPKKCYSLCYLKIDTRPQSQAAASVAAAATQARFLSAKSSITNTSAASSGPAAAGNSKSRTLPPYMVFRYATSATAPNKESGSNRHTSTLAWDITGGADAQPIAIAERQVSPRPLVLLFAWMLSKNEHIEKYRQFWIKRGCDILTVQTAPIDLLLPAIGGRRVAANVYNFLSKIDPYYDEILVHAFSVGGYQFGEFLDQLHTRSERGEPEAKRLFNAVKGFMIDSVAFAEDAPVGLSRAITLNKFTQPILEKSISAFLSATKRFTFNRYKVVESHIIGNRREIPGMLLFSNDDVVSNVDKNYAVIKQWTDRGIVNAAKCWDRSAHVLHYREHPQEYSEAIDTFLDRLAVTKAGNRN